MTVVLVSLEDGPPTSAATTDRSLLWFALFDLTDNITRRKHPSQSPINTSAPSAFN